jgi:hypothetical protein
MFFMDDDAIEIPAKDPLEAAIQVRKKIFDLKRGYRRNLWRCVAEAYAVAYAMLSKREAWKEFLKEDFWNHSRTKRPSVKSTEKALLHVMVFVFDATSKNRYDRAWKYAKALEKPFNDKVPPEHIEEVIEERGGLEKMMRAAVGKRKDAAKRASSSSGDSYAEESDNAENQHNGKDHKRKSADKDKNEEYCRKNIIDSSRMRHKNKPIKPRKREFRFSATKKLATKLRHMTENETARVTIKTIVQEGRVIGKITGVRIILNG